MIKRILIRLLKSRPIQKLVNAGYGRTPVQDGDHLCILPGTPNRLGDLIMNNYLLRLLQPHYDLSYGVMHWYFKIYADFLQSHSYAHRLLVFPDRWWRMFLFIREIRKRRIKAAVLLPFFPAGSDLCFYLAGVPVICAMRGASMVSTHHFNFEKFANRNHYSTGADCILDALGIDRAFLPDELPWFPYKQATPPECKREGDEVLLALHTGGGTFWMRRWPPEKYLELATLFLDHYPGKIFLIGGKEEYPANESLRASLIEQGYHESRIINFCGSLLLDRLASILAASDIFLGNDSGPMHLATAIKKRVICIFGPTNIPYLSPAYIDHKNVVIYQKLDCVPCLATTCRLSEDRQYTCLRDLAVQTVWDKLEETIHIENSSRLRPESALHHK
jgi:ADP-heptose:LPS heptosyltransferase